MKSYFAQIFVRTIRYLHLEGWEWLALFAAMLSFYAWRYPDGRSLASLMAVALTGFTLPYFVRNREILQYPRCRRRLTTVLYVMVGAFLVTQLTRNAHWPLLVVIGYYAVCFGCSFWAVSDPMFEMVS